MTGPRPSPIAVAVANSHPIANVPTRKRSPAKDDTSSIPKPANEQIRAVPSARSRPRYVPSAQKPIATATRNRTWPSSWVVETARAPARSWPYAVVKALSGIGGEYPTSRAGRDGHMPTAIVTGANSGIGRGTAVALARRGFDLGLTWHSDEENLEEAVAECEAEGVRVVHRQVDLSAVPGPDAVVDELADELGGVDVLVSNAAAGHSTPFLEVELEEWEWVIRFALTAQFLVAQRAARRMVKQGRGGRIVFVTSIHELVPLETATAYTAAKHGTGGLMKVMALELAEHGITVNSVAPGEIATKMTGNEDTEPESEDRECVPLGRPGDANEIGAAAAFLASPEASYITGETLVVDCGMHLMAAIANQM